MLIKDLPVKEKQNIEWTLWTLLAGLEKGDISLARELAKTIVNEVGDPAVGKEGMYGKPQLFSVAVIYYVVDENTAGRMIMVGTMPDPQGHNDTYEHKRAMPKSGLPGEILRLMMETGSATVSLHTVEG